MSTKVSLEAIEKIPLFEGLNEAECRQVAAIAQIKEFAPGDYVIRQGQRSQELWVLLEGKCEVVKLTSETNGNHEAVLLAVLEPQSHFGEMSFFHSAPHSASVRAQSPVKLLRIVRGDYEELIQEGCRAAYKLAYNTVGSLAERLRKMDDWVAELMAKTAAQGESAAAIEPTAEAQVQEWSEFRQKMLTSWNM